MRSRQYRLIVVSVMLLVAGWLSLSTPLAGQDDVVMCRNCHADRDYVAAHSPAGDSALFVSSAFLQQSVHAELTCPDCHAGQSAGYPHDPGAAPVPCGQCHDGPGQEWSASIHSTEGAAAAPSCVTCHTAHDVQPASDRDSPTYPLNVAELCGSCHADPLIVDEYFSGPAGDQARRAVSEYYETVHGEGLTRAGLTASATCNDCHESHLVLPANDPRSSVHRRNVVETCGTCHVGILEAYEEGSAHGAAYQADRPAENGQRAPACVDCHSSHEIVRADEPSWFLGVVEECGSCHSRVYETYFDTYHGQVTALGFELTAKCSDCHTPHNMRPASHPASSIYPLNLVGTCGRCHPDANANFVEYYAHGDYRDRNRFPVLFWPWLLMTTLLVSVWGFFALHSMLWLNGVWLERRRSRGKTRRVRE